MRGMMSVRGVEKDRGMRMSRPNREPDITTGTTPMQFWVIPEKDVPEGMQYKNIGWKVIIVTEDGDVEGHTLVLAYSPVKEEDNEESYIEEQIRSAPTVD